MRKFETVASSLRQGNFELDSQQPEMIDMIDIENGRPSSLNCMAGIEEQHNKSDMAIMLRIRSMTCNTCSAWQ